MGDDAELWAKVKEERKKDKQIVVDKFHNVDLPKIKEFIAQRPSLVLKQFNDNHFRVSNSAGKFVDFWHTRAMRKLDGKTCGLGYNEKNLHREITKLNS